ncbi:MAG: hypothetical protein H8E24_13215, partial [Verrucomicrobia bacterium]|nr:hypothetical protein [Verrucomicrobiota bacterium]
GRACSPSAPRPPRRGGPTNHSNRLAALSNRPATPGEALANRKNPFAALGETVA